DEQRLLAESNANEAERQSLEARKNALEARRQSLIAKSNALEANKQKDLADENSDKAYRLRLLSIAQSMAVKSLQVEDAASRGVIAMQAYKFHSENGGNIHSHDIYDGLYYALKILK